MSNKCKGSFAGELNRISNYLIDWTRVGELLRAGNHKYSFSEIVPRVFVAFCTILPLVYFRTLTTQVILWLIVMFVISHTVVILPLIVKRSDAKKECGVIIETIKTAMCECDKPTTKECDVCTNINKIMTYAADHNKSSATWGGRLRKLKELQVMVEK